MFPILRIRLRHEVSRVGPLGQLLHPSRENEVVCFYIGLVAGEAGSALRLVDRSAVDKPAEAAASAGRIFFFESLTMI
jgi:hypothetical protein